MRGNISKSLDDIRKENNNNKSQLMKIYNLPNINFLLKEYNISFDDFFELFLRINCGLHDIIWEIFSSPSELKELIELINNDISDDEIFIHFRRYNN